METFDFIKTKFGFGFMRLPMKDGEVDEEETKRMVDLFLENGFNYFDTAHGYLKGKSELALKSCLTSRYPREAYLITNKLTDSYFHKEEDIRPLVEVQLKACGVDYFDFYLMHSQNEENFKKFKECRAYETCFALKEEGKFRHVGISFHDKAYVLEEILKEYPEIEIVQIQLNYLDYDSASIESRKCLEVCQKYDKPVIVMEPVKGGNLVNLPEEAKEIFDRLNGGSYASYALRFAASFDQVRLVLSGMSNLEQMKDNISFMKEFKPLNETEQKAINEVVQVFQKMNMIPCTGCRYCIEENTCPMGILIPGMFSNYNTKHLFHDWNADFYYQDVLTLSNGKASECIQCGMCENVCPQQLPIRELLKDVAKEFEKQEKSDFD